MKNGTLGQAHVIFIVLSQQIQERTCSSREPSLSEYNFDMAKMGNKLHIDYPGVITEFF